MFVWPSSLTMFQMRGLHLSQKWDPARKRILALQAMVLRMFNHQCSDGLIWRFPKMGIPKPWVSIVMYTGWWYTYPLKNTIPNIWKNKKCSKPPLIYHFIYYNYIIWSICLDDLVYPTSEYKFFFPSKITGSQHKRGMACLNLREVHFGKPCPHLKYIYIYHEGVPAILPLKLWVVKQIKKKPCM